ncbi:hypothetical protein [Pseudoduganella sp. RAF53_2]|uniref:hypothetical protein n=1 Tax=unclassified Pseudoduganella TaxID=2637179 RepID=UPI003F97D4A6
MKIGDNKPLAAIVIALACAGAQAQTQIQPMNRIVQDNAYSQLGYFFDRLVQEKDGLVIDGYAPFKSGDKFLPGKIAAGLGYVLLNTPKDDPRLAQRLADYRAIADLTVGMDNHTWGIYYYLGALYRLKQAGLQEQAVSPETLAKLREKLDWRHFVRVPQWELIDLPTNYFGVAFSIARLRMLLGWEDDSASKVLLDKMLKHYATYSGQYGFSDETPGEGRFDRYSILLIAEICERYVETGLEVTPELKALLRKAATLALNVANADGQGFSFGRSLGPYGETAMLEILSISAYLGVLTPEEKDYAYTISSRIAQRYMEFWYNPQLRSVDMWNQGRRTDGYRGKHRILGENFSLLHQLIFTNEQWNMAGMKDKAPRQDLQAWLERTRPRFSLTTYAKDEYDRALAVYRDKSHVFSLSMINGGASQHANSPYYPLPFSPRIVSGIADSGAAHPQLLPKFTLADGAELLPTAWIKDIQTAQKGQQYIVSYHQDELDKLGKNAPQKDGRIKLQTEYVLEPGRIVRKDTYTPQGEQQVKRVSLEFGSFSSAPTVHGNVVRFGEGEVEEFSVDGLQECSVAPTTADDKWKAPYGPMKSVVSCSTGSFTMNKPLTITWTMRYH